MSDSNSSHGGGHHDITVTIVATNNESREFTISDHDRVDKVAREAVKTFDDLGFMEKMDCSLILVVDGVASRPLDDGGRLDEQGVHNGARLVLKPKKTKTDG